MNRYVSLYYELRDGSARWVAVDAPSPKEAMKATGLHRQCDTHVETWRLDALAAVADEALRNISAGPGKPYVVLVYDVLDGELRFEPIRSHSAGDAFGSFEDDGLIVDVVYGPDLEGQIARLQKATPKEIAEELAHDQAVAAHRLLQAEPTPIGVLASRLAGPER